MAARLTIVTGVRPLGDNLSVVSLRGIEHSVVANRLPDGGFRWAINEPVVYVDEGMIVPEDVLQQRGYWNSEKSIGLLEGKRGNRVKMRRFGPEDDRVESRGLLFKIEDAEGLFDVKGIRAEVFPVCRGEARIFLPLGSDAAEFLGLTQNS